MKKPIDPRMIKARYGLVMSQPFFGTLALHLELEEANCKTMATDGRKLFYSKKWLDTLTEPETEGVIAHETMHCAYRHMTRRQNRDPKIWNVAGDFAINTDLLAAGFTLPKTDCIDKTGRFKGMNAEQIYAALMSGEAPMPQSAQEPEPQDGEGDSDDDAESQPGEDDDDQDGEGDGAGDGDDEGEEPEGGSGGAGDDEGDQQGESGSGQAPGEGEAEGESQGGGRKQIDCDDPGDCGGVIDGAPTSDPAENDRLDKEWEINVRQAMNVAAAAGKNPGTMKSIAAQIEKRTVDWRQILRRFIDDVTSRDYSWTRPNRRLLPMGLTLPSLIADGVSHVGFIIDSSGSTCNPVTLGNFQTEAQAALDEGNIEKITVIYCDTRVTHVHEFRSGDIVKLEIRGGGGTLFAPALRWFETNAPDVAAIIYFTDLYCDDFSYEPQCPVMWAVYGPDASYRPKVIPFGERVDLID